ncbi:sensor histidine kinase [Sulfurimicrobium lacus]|uniref:sensor histidine kinase n=1 Tax=Sulfurimicrobium lacus TaxID=2715678 RepID=UPI0015645EE4|nr:ATP-binding protein [Sulfurimicrobium lacus]
MIEALPGACLFKDGAGQPLAAANTYLRRCVELIESGRHDKEHLGEEIKAAHFQTERAGKIIAHLRDFIRKGRGDRGEGIPESEIELIFNPFASSTDDGLGLGLTICRSIVKSCGGQIRVFSSLDSGSIFTITFSLDDHA